MCPNKDRRIPRPPALFMRTPCQVALASLFKTRGNYVATGIDALKAKIPQLGNWQYLETRGQDLVVFLSTLENEVDTLQQHHLQRLREKAGQNDEDDGLAQSYTQEQGDSLASSAAQHHQAIREGGGPVSGNSDDAVTPARD